MASKVKRRSISVETKMEIIKAVEAGSKKAEVGRKYGIVSSTLSTVLKNRESIVVAFESSKFSPSRKRFRLAEHEDLEEAVLSWFHRMQAKKQPVSNVQIQQKAGELAKALGIQRFKASTGWVSRFKERHYGASNVRSQKASATTPNTSGWLRDTLPGILHGFEERNIFAADETGLYYRLTPDKTPAFKVEQCSGGKHSKERITVMLCANMDGTEKMRPLVIGRYKKSQCLQGVWSLPVDYCVSRKAWMVSDLFTSWVQDLDKGFTLQGRKVLLFVDSCAAHPKIANLKSITLHFLPSLPTPMDEGIKMSVKAQYRHRLLQLLLHSYDAGDVPKPISVKQAIDMVYGAWQRVRPKTIAKCFRKAGFSVLNHAPSQISVTEQESEQPECESVTQDQEGEEAAQVRADEPASSQPADQSASQELPDESAGMQPKAEDNQRQDTQLNAILQSLKQKLEDDQAEGGDGENEEADEDQDDHMASIWACVGRHIGLSQISLKDYVGVDTNLRCRQTSKHQDTHDEQVAKDAGCGLGPQIDVPFPAPSTSEAFNCLSRLRDYLYSRPDTSDEHFASVARLETHLYQCREINIAQRNTTYIMYM